MYRFSKFVLFILLFAFVFHVFPAASYADPFQVGSIDTYADRLFAENRTDAGNIAPSPVNSGRDLRSAHKYMGYGTLVMAVLASVSASSHSAHRAASYSAIALGGATVATGFMEYDGYIDLSDGISRYDTHAVLGTVGLLAFTAAVVMAEADQSHSGFGVASAVSMGLSAVVIKW